MKEFPRKNMAKTSMANLKARGRPKGIPNKISQSIKEMIEQALQEAGGVEYLRRRALDTPGPFLSLVGKILPLQIQGDPNAPLVIITKAE